MQGLRKFLSRLGVAGPGKAFLRDDSAVVSVEAAFILLPFLALLGATVDASMLFFRATQLQVVAENAGRKFLTRGLADGLTYQQFLDQHVCTWKRQNNVVAPGTLGKMFDCSKVLVDIQIPSEWKDADMSDSFVMRSSANMSDLISMPQAGEIAVLRIVYPVTTFFGFGIPAGSSSLIQQIKTSTDVNMKDPGVTNILLGVAAFRVEPGA